jgi:hypothetical protein
VGWKVFYKVDESTFRDLYNKQQLWGDLVPMKITIAGVEHYGAGKYAGWPTPYLQSPKTKITYGAMTNKARVTVKAYLIADANSDGYVDVGFIAYKNDDTAKDEQGYNFHGASVHLSNATASLAVSELSMVCEINGSSIHLVADGTDLGTYTLDAVPTSFTLAVAVRSASKGNVGVAIYEVVGEYYDWMEDVMAQLMQMFNIMMWVMIAVMIVSLIVSFFRRRGGERGGE